MATRGALQQLVSRGIALATDRRVRVASQLLLLAGLVFVVLRLRTTWHESRLGLDHVDWPLLALALLVSGAGVAASAGAWLAILRPLGVDSRRWQASVFFQAQLGKYIPGSLWQYAGRATLARTAGLPLRPVALSLPIEVAAAALAAASVAPLVFGWWGAAGAALLLLAFSLGSVGGVGRRLRATADRLRAGRLEGDVVGAAAAGMRVYAGVWLLIGLGFWLTARALFGVPASDAPIYAGAFAAAWVVGFVVVVAPGGIGVREAVLVALLRGKLGSADAVALAAVSRGMLTVLDLAAAGAAALLLRRRTR